MTRSRMIIYLALITLIVVLSVYLLFFAPIPDGGNKQRHMPPFADTEKGSTNSIPGGSYKNFGP